MRFFTLIILISLICLVYGQEMVSSTTSAPSPFSRLFFWFKRPDQKEVASEKISSIPDPLNRNDFSSSLPREPIDRMISDAISDRIIEESKQQQLFSGNPFISEKHEDSQSTEVNTQQVVSDRDGYGKNLPDTGNDKIPLTEALRIVNSSNLTDCVARVICELSCNANAYGNQGRIVFRNMIKLQFDQSIRDEDAKFFRQFAAKGRQLVQAKRDCNECFSIYPACKSNSRDLVAVSSMFRL